MKAKKEVKWKDRLMVLEQAEKLGIIEIMLYLKELEQRIDRIERKGA